MDLSEWLENGRVRALLDVIDQLPSASRLYEAMVNDPAEAATLAKARLNAGDSEEWSPRVSEFDLTAHMLRELIHETRMMRAVLIQANGGKPGELKPFPAPRTEIDAAVERLEREWTEDFLGKLGFDKSYI